MRHIDNVDEVGRRIRERREELGITQRGLAFDGCTYAYLSRLENGGRQPSAQVLEEIARRLDTTAHYLKTGEEDPRELALELAAKLTDHAIRGPGSRNGEHLAMLEALDAQLELAGYRVNDDEGDRR